ncbi:MAG TPA: hypothetical protein VIO60_11335, partial [Rectinemataceae bacterium]
MLVEGAVRYEGPYARRPGLKLSSIIKADQLLDFASLDYAELTRLGKDGSYSYMAFAPRDVLSGAFDLVLEPKDSIRIVLRTPHLGAMAPVDQEKFKNSVLLGGQVARPSPFALKPGLKLSGVLGKDQLLADTNLDYAELTRLKADGSFEYITFRPAEVVSGAWDLALAQRDRVRLVKRGYVPAAPSFDTFSDAVQAEGPFEYSGLFAWKRGMSLSELLARAKPSLEANQVYAEILRPRGGTRVDRILFAPREVSSGAFDLGLEARDLVRLYAGSPPEAEVDKAVEVVRLSGAARYPGPFARTPSLKLSSLLSADQILETTSPDYAEISRLASDGRREYLAFAPRWVREGSYDLDLRAGDSVRLVQRTPFGGTFAGIDAEKFANQARILGRVARPEAFAIQEGTKLSSILGPDQFLLDTNLHYAEITRPRADGKDETLTFRPSELLAGAFDLVLEPRDRIELFRVGYSPAKPDFERFPNAVKISGPVAFPGLYAWTEGTKLSTILKLAKPALETNQVYAEVMRPLGGTAFEYLTFAPREIIAGSYDLALKARDTIKLFTTVPVALNLQGAEAEPAAPRTMPSADPGAAPAAS